MSPNEALAKLLNGDNFVLLVGGSIAITAIVFGAVRSIVGSLARERSRREIAAYIAEGSMTAEQGEKLMAAASPKRGCC